MFNLRKKVICLTSAATLAATTVMVPTGTPVYAKTEPVEMKSVELDDWTIGLYLCGSNLESKGSCASNDIIEILESKVSDKFNEDVNIIIQTGGSKEWHFKEAYSEKLAADGLSESEIDQIIPKEIDENKIQEYKVNFKHEYKDDKGNIKTVPTIEFIRDVAEYNEDDKEVCMGNPKYLESFLNDMYKEFPAEHNILDLWNHGGGITVGVCVDEIVPDDQITLRELLATLDTTDTKGDNKLDIIGYDACLMSNYESWNKLSAYANYGVGSLTSEPGDGWYYTPVIEELSENYTNKDYTSADLSECIVDSYEDYYKLGGVYDQNNASEDEEEFEDLEGFEDFDEFEEEDEEDEEENVNASAMLCSVNLSKLNNSIPAFGDLSDTLLKLYADKEGYAELRENFAMKSFAYSGCMWNSHIIGINDFLKAIDETAESRIEALGDSKKGYDPIFKELYEKALKQTELVRELVSNSLIKAYNGHEGNAYENSGSMSLFFPDYLGVRDEMAFFTVDEYSEYAVDSRYALYTYYTYNKSSDFSFEDYESEFGYDAESGELTVSVPEESTSAASVSYTKIIEKDGKYVVASGAGVYPESEDCGILKTAIDDTHLEAMGMILAYKLDDDIYSANGKYNGIDGEFNFKLDEETGKYNLIGFTTDDDKYIDDFNEGDVITFESNVYDSIEEDETDENSTSTISKDYVVKKSDINEDESGVKSVVLPIECVEDQGEVYVLLVNAHNMLGLLFGVIPEDFVTMEYKLINYSKVKAYGDTKITIAQDEFALTGEKIEPTVLFDGKTDKFVEGEDYEIEYEDNIGLGTARVIIRPLGDYEICGEKVIEFNIVKVKNADGKIVYKTVVVKAPKQAKIKTVKNNKKKALTVKWKKVKGAKGYEVRIARNKKFTKGKKVKTIKNAKKASLTFKKLKKNKTYFVKVRAYTLDPNGNKVYGDWSKVKKVKIRK